MLLVSGPASWAWHERGEGDCGISWTQGELVSTTSGSLPPPPPVDTYLLLPVFQGSSGSDGRSGAKGFKVSKDLSPQCMSSVETAL